MIRSIVKLGRMQVMDMNLPARLLLELQNARN